MNWNWIPFGRYTRFLERTLAESRADMLERLREKDDIIKQQRIQIGALEAKVLRLENPLLRMPSTTSITHPTWGQSGTYTEPTPNFAEDLGGDWQSRLEQVIKGIAVDDKEEVSHEASTST